MHLVALVEVAMVTFALAYYTMAIHSQTQMSGIHTRLDALYFSATTTTTVGYGDIHSIGQLAPSTDAPSRSASTWSSSPRSRDSSGGPCADGRVRGWPC